MEWGISLKEKTLKSLNKKIITPSIITIVVVTLIGIVSFRYYFQKEFDKYIGNKTLIDIEEVIRDISHQYDSNGVRIESVESISMSSLEKGMFISIYDKDNREIWNVETHYEGMCTSMAQSIINNMQGNKNRSDSFDEYVEPIQVEGEVVGYIKVKYYGPVFYLDNEVELIRVANRIIILMGFLLIVSYAIISLIISRKVESQINNVMLKAKYIADGEYDKEINIDTDIIEINNLSESINSLSQTIKKQEDIRKRLTGDISHELKTPLTNIQSHLEAMIDGIWEPTNSRLVSVKEESERLTGLVLDMQKLNKYDEYSIKLEKEKFNISKVITNILFNFSNTIHKKGLKFVFKENDKVLFADKDKITQALINLISNAIKYSKENGKIEIHIQEYDESIIIKIKDNGIGISNEDLPYIFERFYRTDKSRTRLTGGTGIGLTITKAIVESHGGKVRAVSKLGEWSEFDIILPANIAK